MSDDYGQFTIIDNYTTIKKENKTILPDYINNPEYYYLDDYNTLKKKDDMDSLSSLETENYQTIQTNYFGIVTIVVLIIISAKIIFIL
tara:strand:- start:3520 stop:3783 length:264 start_codon:yes stop_codon:yes gene_type:complete